MRRRLPRWLIAIVLLAVLAVAGQVVVLFVVGAVDLGDTGDSEDTTAITVADGNVAFKVRVPGGTAITGVSVGEDSDGCGRAVYDLNAHGLVVEAVRSDCEPESQQINNGHHGTYRTLDDVPKPQDVEKVKTYLGPAVVFTQKYLEATNVTTDYTEPVAIVTLDDPVDADYPTLVVRSEQGELDRDAFTRVVESLIEPP